MVKDLTGRNLSTSNLISIDSVDSQGNSRFKALFSISFTGSLKVTVKCLLCAISCLSISVFAVYEYVAEPCHKVAEDFIGLFPLLSKFS